MIVDNKALAVYFEATVNNVFKILPLYEEENVGIVIYVETLAENIESLKDVIEIKNSYEYLSLLATLVSIKKELIREDSKKETIKREVFKGINITKNLIAKIEDGV